MQEDRVHSVVDEDKALLDFVIVGAGPHALAFACRLLEAKPDSIYDEKDLTTRHKYHPVLAKNKKTNRGKVSGGDAVSQSKSKGGKNRRTEGKANQQDREPAMSFVAVDESGGWMRRWNDLMQNLGVRHLRSPLNAHPDPFDVTSLNAFAHEQRREEELKCLGISPRSSGKEDKKKVRDHSAYIFANNDRIMLKVPSVPLFKSFCQALIKRYDLDSHIITARATRIEPCFDDVDTADGCPIDAKPSSFKVHLSTGKILHCKRVVLATGQTQPRIPSWVPESPQSKTSIIHSDKMRVNDPGYQSKVKGKRILIVGGGITSYHLTRAGLMAGAAKVTVATRKHIKVQHFDVSLNWAGRYKKVHYSKFYALDDPQERYKVLQEARGEGGGTIPPHMYSYLKEMHAWKSNGKFTLMEKAEVEQLEWIPANQACSATEGGEKGRDDGDYWCVRLSNGQVLHVDYIWLATGRVMNAEEEPLLSELLRCKPIPLVHGLPVLHSSLRWSKDWDVFVLGAYAALQLGPDAVNLAGARSGSMRAFDAVSSEENFPAEGKAGNDGTKKESWCCREEDLNPYSLLNEISE